MESLIANFIQFSYAISKFLFLERGLDIKQCLRSILRFYLIS